MTGNCFPSFMFDETKNILYLTNDADSSYKTGFESKEEINIFLELLTSLRDKHFPENPYINNFLNKRVFISCNGKDEGLNGIVQDIKEEKNGFTISLGPSKHMYMTLYNIHPSAIKILE